MTKSKKSYEEVTKGTKDVVSYSESLEHLKINIGHHDVITTLVNMLRCRSDFDDLVWKSNRKNPKLWLTKASIGLVLIFGYSLMPKQTTHIAERTIDAYVPGLIQSQNHDQKDISNNGSKSR